MPGKKKLPPATYKAKQLPAPQGFSKELKAAFWITLPVGVVAALIVLWPSLFPVAPEQLVEVAWTHECTCAHSWIKSLRAEGFTVYDYELDDTSTMRRQWRVPDSIRGCHPAFYFGYFLDGHISAETLRRMAREHPQAIGLQKLDTVKPDAEGRPTIVNSQLVLIDANGTAKAWLGQEIKAAVP